VRIDLNPASMNKRPDNKRRANSGKPKPVAPAPDSRSAALLILDRVLFKRQALDEVLKQEIAKDGVLVGLSSRDRAFTRLLVATTLRRLGQIDDVLQKCLAHPLEDTKPRLKNILRLGVTQLVFLKTPEHAAVDATVRLAGRESSSRGLINAVLRRLIREADAMAPGDDTAHLNTPEWLFKSWRDAFGEDQALAIARAHLQEPPLDLTFASMQALDNWQQELDADIILNGSLRRVTGGRIEDIAGYDAGDWWVQDAAATLPARLLFSALGETAGRNIIDLCAAPGGKTLQLCSSGANVTAVDRSAKRLELVARNLQRANQSAELITADAAKWQPDEAADAVLLDAPCTATGTFRRHPDAAYLKSAADVGRMASVQSGLIDAAINMVKPGGVLVYCTCSLQTAEGEAHAMRLADHEALEHLPVQAAEIGGLAEAIDASGNLRTLPSHLAEKGGLDGFFAARYRRRQT